MRLDNTQIEISRSPLGGWTKAKLAGGKMPLPPTRGWHGTLLKGRQIPKRNSAGGRRLRGGDLVRDPTQSGIEPVRRPATADELSVASSPSQAAPQDERLRDFYLRHFETVIARDAADLAEAYRLRHQVYCVENAFEDPADNPDGLERDFFDERASHSLLVHRSSGAVAGTVRLVLPDRERLRESFAFQQLCTDPLARDPERFPVERMAEVSRFCISKAFRKRFADGPCDHVEDPEVLTENHRLIPNLTLGLIEGLVRMSVEQGVEYWCAVMEPTLLRLLTRLGIHFDNIGGRVDHHGKRQPCYQRLDRFLERVRLERPDVWAVLTDDGRHWEIWQKQWAASVAA